MKTEEIIDRLRHPQKYYKMPATLQKDVLQTQEPRPLKEHSFLTMLALGLAAAVVVIAALVWLITSNLKTRADNILDSINPQQLQGPAAQAEFNPSKNVTYVQIYEGQDRNVAVDELGTTLPVINRFNFQSITAKNYGIIGMAPWALTENLSANIKDPELIRYLLNRQEVGEAFITRGDVAPLLADPQLLAAFAQDAAAMNDFFYSDVVQQILANPELVRKIGGSRFMSYLLTSKAVKYYRDHPQEAVKIIHANPVLEDLQQNPAVRQAVTENYYLKSIAPQLLETQTTSPKK